jgi:hypothetical protein
MAALARKARAEAAADSSADTLGTSPAAGRGGGADAVFMPPEELDWSVAMVLVLSE